MNYLDKLDRLRKRQKLSIRELSLMCDLTEPSIHKILSQKCVPFVSSVEQLCNALEISMAELFCGENEIVAAPDAAIIRLVAACSLLSDEANAHLLWFAKNLPKR